MKLKDVINHPLMSPIVDPVREIAGAAWKNLSTGYKLIADDFTREMKASGNPSKALMAVYSNCFNEDKLVNNYTKNYIVTRAVTYALGLIGAGLAGMFAGIDAVVERGATGLTVPLLASAVATTVATPFIFPLAASALQTVWNIPVKGIPHMAHGLYKAVKFATNPKGYANQQTAQKIVTQAKNNASTEDAKASIGTIHAQLDSLSPEDREKVLESLQQKFGDTFDRISGKTSQKIDDLAHKGTDTERQSAPIPVIQKKKVDLPSATS